MDFSLSLIHIFLPFDAKVRVFQMDGVCIRRNAYLDETRPLLRMQIALQGNPLFPALQGHPGLRTGQGKAGGYPPSLPEIQDQLAGRNLGRRGVAVDVRKDAADGVHLPLLSEGGHLPVGKIR